MMSEPNINIKVKMINNIKNYSVNVNKNCPVEVLKQACKKKTLIPIESINRIIILIIWKKILIIYFKERRIL